MTEGELRGKLYDNTGFGMEGWRNVERPGYFGRRRDEKVATFNQIYGKDNWRLVWVRPFLNPVDPTDLFQRLADEPSKVGLRPIALNFANACREFYEESYVTWLARNPAELEFACTYGECIDNAPTNVHSGLDYSKQESYSTHIQDIAMRNALLRLSRKFEGPADKILVIRSKDSEGFRFGPGNVPFSEPKAITQPSKCPAWANEGSVEDFWQSNKWLQVRL